MINLFKPKRASSVLGLAFDGNRLELAHVRRNGSLQVREHAMFSLALSPLNDAPELVGQEIRNHLDKLEIREKRCAVCLPLSWILTAQTQVPEMSDADRASFLQLEAERGFHSGMDTLVSANSLYRTPNGETHAMMLAAPRNQVETLQRVLRAAKLRPLTFALAVTALQPAAAETGCVILLAVRQNTVDLQVTAGGGIVALRALDNAIETQGSQKMVAADMVAQEIRITLGQLPGGLADAPAKLKILGQTEAARQFISELTPLVATMGLKVELMDKATNAAFDKPVPAEIAASSALALAANYVRGVDSTPELLPPKVQPWKQLVTTKLSPRKLAYAGAAVGGIALCVAIAFGIQQYQISKLQSKWDAMLPEYNELTADQQQIHKFRPWYQKSFPQILSKLWSAFPEDGSVSVKTLELHDVSAVTCSGNALDNASFLRLHAKLADDTNEISALHAEVRGQKPMQFTLNFQWGEAVANGE